MPNQATFYGNIEEGDDFSQYSELELLTSALTLNNWKIDSHNNLGGGYNTFTISNGNISVNLHIYLKKVMWRHRNPDEKGIQFSANRITTGYEVVQDNNNITLMLGIYKREAYDDYLIVAWDPFEWGNLGKACNCFIDVHALAKAFQIGFSIDNSKLPRKVFSFKPEFIHYYITNKNKLHELDIDLVSNDEGFINTNSSDYTNSNTIYYGAPGTGKSYKVDQIIKGLDKKFYERVTFHPEYDNASFIGGYKPISEKNEEGKDVIKYEFVPQAFANIYKRAWQDLDNQYYLVIEEINRGNCAEIFGELFQLLDRNSGYTITPSNELYTHLVEEFGYENHEGIIKGLQLPPNLAILATMNTSDQSLFPMDSAFKRRWDWEYVPICYDEVNEEGGENKSYNFVIDLGNGSQYSWIKFIEYINLNHIKENPNLGMDKCIGNYFVKPEDGDSISLKQFINKVVFYLWNDVFKDEDNSVFEENSSYEDFFPITTNGLKKVTELFERIGLEKLDQNSEEQTTIDLAAEPQEPYGE
ncbi:AAA family ATPase [Empedobacter falsenii]|uniref:AAA family ATPase n=1 Tax=Empedobacter falsenii TaxID=343874 RepID=UPI001C8E0C6C|nr:AAA family ATPase [Empedobacter falsenii]MBY0066652.1 AAA family ATPase [Empedobacter falsenii]